MSDLVQNDRTLSTFQLEQRVFSQIELFEFISVVSCLPSSWKENKFETGRQARTSFEESLNTVTSQSVYKCLVKNIITKATSETHFENVFPASARYWLGYTLFLFSVQLKAK